jgi:hypothetical protein
MRHAVISLILLAALSGCISTPRPFEHDNTGEAVYQPKQDKLDVTIETPANMPERLADRLVAALAVELQAYGIVAALQPARAPLKLAGAMRTRDAALGSGIEIEIDWYLLGGGQVQGPATSKTNAQSQDYAEATDWLVSRIAQQAAPRVATLMGRPPGNMARSLGQVAAGVTVPETPADFAPTQTSASTSPDGKPAAATPAAPAPPQVKVMVGAITGAPSDGNRQLFSGMRRALGSNKIVVIDKAGPDTFAVTAAVSLTPIDEHSAQLSVKWVLQDPTGKEVGSIEQSNPVPVAATRGTWAGFGDIVASAAVEGVLELLDKALALRH